MTSARWTAVDDYFGHALGADDLALTHAQEAAAAAGLPAIAVSALHGKMLHLMAMSIGARRVLEVGTLGGYSAIWLARAVGAGGKVVTLEIDPKHADVACASIAKAGLAERVDVMTGSALDLLPTLEGPFDFSFIDADKESNADYFAWALKLSRPGALIVVDNVVRDGRVIDAGSSAQVDGVRRMLDAIAKEPRVTATAVQTVGVKGYDGFLLARVND